MGRRKQKQLAFLQGNSLAEELEASSSDDDDPGGLHIGGIVIRAPARSRAAEQHGRNPSRAPAAAPVSSSRPAGVRNQPQQLQQEELERLFASEDSLDDELRDYLDNVKQHDDDSGEASEPDGAAAAAAPAAAQQGSRRHAAAAAADVDSSSSEVWEELGSRPGLGFAGSAAARFAAVSLDEALEGALGSDMQRESNNSFDSDGSSSSSSNYSRSGSSSDEDAPEQLDLTSLDASTAVVVDAQGRPMAVWESLTLQQRFPVQARAGEAGNSTSSSRRRRQQQGRQTPSRSSSGRAAAAGLLPAELPADAPAFECEVTAAAAKAAYAAALAAADVDAVQRQQRRQQQKSLAKGARHGQLLPGEKKRLRKEKIAAKRCERRGQQGQGALALLAAVERFALGGRDMEVLPPCGKHKQAFVRYVATLYGVRASAQGGSSSGRTALVLASTPDTGKPTADAAARLQTLLAAELTREITAAAIAAGPGERPAAAAAAGAAGQQGGSSRQRRTPQRQGSRGAAAAAAAESAFQQPVAFVSAGTLDPNHSSTRTDTNEVQQHVSILPSAAAAAAAANEPAGPGDMDAAAAAAAAVAQEEGAETGPQTEAAAGIHAAAGSSARAAAAAADMGEFLQSLLLDDEETPAAAPAAAAAAYSGQSQQQQQQQQQQDEPAWFEDRGRCWPAAGAGLGFVQEAAPTAAAAVPAAEAGCTVAAAAAAAAPTEGGASAPLYNRAPVHFGLGFSAGLGFVQQQEEGMQQQSADISTAEARAEAAEAAGAGSSRQGSQQLQVLEDKFAALRAAPNPAAAKRQQRRQQRQQQTEKRLTAPNTAMGPAVGAAAAAMSPMGTLVVTAAADDDGDSGDDGSPGLVVTLGMTAQQVKKAKKQLLRNQRRESRSAAAAAGDGQGQAAAAAAAAAVGNVHGSFAGFEAHTRGIGSRLLAGWGWREGEGLGRARQGRPEPLQAVRRERQLGLGAE